ncbi:hypothetical protein [Burkholderia cepacia]|uniref:hypothetical protein n=1 Tax=Burkholderia cepacia TaxID=292 RepID=UPI0006693E66|nr:hypothetical protein [Burkholderia cepacia]
MSTTLLLDSFALPPSFPPEFVPMLVARFVADCVPGLTKSELLARTENLGWMPTWRPLPKLKRGDIEAYDFGLTVDGLGVPLVARMRRGSSDVMPATMPVRDPRQLSLF